MARTNPFVDHCTQFLKVLMVRDQPQKVIFNQDRDINSFEIQTVMIPGNETKLSGVSGLEIDGSHPERGQLGEEMPIVRN